MKVSVNVANKQEKEAFLQAMDDESVKAFVLIVGTLKTLPSQRARVRALNFVADYFAERDGADGNARPAA